MATAMKRREADVNMSGGYDESDGCGNSTFLGTGSQDLKAPVRTKGAGWPTCTCPDRREGDAREGERREVMG